MGGKAKRSHTTNDDQADAEHLPCFHAAIGRCWGVVMGLFFTIVAGIVVALESVMDWYVHL